MRRTTIGKTGLVANRLGMGGIPIQRLEETEAVEAVLYAVEKGVDFIDTSRAYTTSERRIGKALKQTDKKVVLASKSHNRTSEGIQADVATSLKELQVDSIDLYQCHFVRDEEDYKQVISPGGALSGLIKSKEEGLVRHIGISSHSLPLLDRIIEDGFFETIMVCFSFLEPAAKERVIPRAIEKNVGVIAMKPFSGGIIEKASLALKYVLSQPGVVVIPGVEHKALIEENWEIFQGSYDLDEAERREIEEICKRNEKAYCRRCDYCQPCTEDISIQTVLGLKTMVKRLGASISQRDWFLQVIERARHCSECGECMTRCPYELPIPDLIKENLKLVDKTIKPS